MPKIEKKLIIKILFLLIALSGLLLRFYQYEWDQHTHLHPDERFLTMVTTDISLPNSISQYFNTDKSPLNPTNYESYKFFVYGTFPLILTRTIGEITNQTSYDQIYLVGRILSAFADFIVIVALFILAKKILTTSSYLSLVPSFLYAFSPLPLQLSHYYAVDTFLSSFLFLSFVFMVFYFYHQKKSHLILSAVFLGLSLSSKITALLFLPFLGFLILASSFSKKQLSFPKLIQSSLIFGFVFLLIFRIFQPYAFTGIFNLNPVFIDNLKTLAEQSEPNSYFPPSVQWLSKTKLIFPFTNILFWGIGLPFFLLAIIYLFKLISQHRIKTIKLGQKEFVYLIALLWVLILFIYQGTRFTYAMRYFLPIYPFIFFFFLWLLRKFKTSFLIYPFLILHLLWGLAFISIYSRTQTRIQASSWIYQNLPAGSNLTNEYWDDPLPLYLDGHDPYIYQSQMIPFYDPESAEKWSLINPILQQADFIIMSSNRLWASIPKVPALYPQTTLYYQNLFAQKLGFVPVAKFVSYPGFPLSFLNKCIYLGPTDYPAAQINNWFEVDPYCSTPGLYFRDDTADESFTVYDHPQVLIFARQETNTAIQP